MVLLPRFRKEFVRCARRNLASRAIVGAIVSFTFDDFPRSALEVGGSILMERGMRATFYACLGRMGQRTEVGELCTLADIEALVAAGHELGCHTLTHRSCQTTSAAEVQRSCEENSQMAADLLGGYHLRNFAFPSGHVTLSAKSRLAVMFDTCRGIQSGINGSPADFALLRANAIYSRCSLRELEKVICHNAVHRGWLILYTHDIAAGASPFGCTEEQFRKVVSMVVASGAEVLTVREASRRFHGSRLGARSMPVSQDLG